MAHNEYYNYNQGTINGQILMNVCVFDIIVKEVLKKMGSVKPNSSNDFILSSTKTNVLGSIKDNDVIIEIHLKIRYGVNVSKITKEIQKAVANEVLELTGVTPKQINIEVDNIVFD